MNLNQLMKQNVIPMKIVEYTPSQRILDENGEPMVWKLKALTTDELTVIGETYRGEAKRITLESILTSLVEPSRADFENSELQESWGAYSPAGLLNKMLLPGELVRLEQTVQSISGFDDRYTTELANEIKKK